MLIVKSSICIFIGSSDTFPKNMLRRLKHKGSLTWTSCPVWPPRPCQRCEPRGWWPPRTLGGSAASGSRWPASPGSFPAWSAGALQREGERAGEKSSGFEGRRDNPPRQIRKERGEFCGAHGEGFRIEVDLQDRQRGREEDGKIKWKKRRHAGLENTGIKINK